MAITTTYEIQNDDSYALHPAVYKVIRDESEVYSKTLALDSEIPAELLSSIVLEIKGFIVDLSATIPGEPYMSAELILSIKKGIRALTYLADILPDSPISGGEEGKV
jgi:hypothetical protein